MSVKTLCHYRRVGLLEPAEVDPVAAREYYVVVSHVTFDKAPWRNEIGWLVFQVASST